MSLSGMDDILEAVFRWTWQTSLYASVLMAFVWAVQWAFRTVLSPRWRYALGLLILLRLVMPGAPAAPFSVFNLSRLLSHASVPVEAPTAPPTPHRGPAEISRTEGRWTTELVPVSSRRFDWFRVARLTWVAGWIGILVVVLRQQRRFSARVKAERIVGEPPLFDLLGSCMQLMRVRRSIEIVSVPQLAVPALFGWRRPRLLAPPEVLQKLSEEELRMIFLHELAHLKRHDILLNWLMVFVGALHWFNPLVWLALRRLRADREMVCDAMVLERLQASERWVYGNTLVKLLDDFSGAGFCPSLVPVINNKQEIKRRVIMIAKFKSTGRAAAFVSAAAVLALCAFTFTRAADKTKTRQKGEAAMADPYFIQTESARAARLPALKRKLEELEQRINRTQKELDELRLQLAVPGPIAAAKSEDGFADETLPRLERERVSVEANYKGLAELLNGLKDLKARGSAHLRTSILTLHDDPLLSKLLQDLWSTETTLAKLEQSFGPDSPEIKSVAAMRADLDHKVSERIDGILSGFEAKAAAAKARRDALMERIRDVKTSDADGTAKYRPYFQVKRDLESLQKIRDALYLKILEEEYGVQVSKENSKE
jgi:beta-lactamase regulating signal transducer with metallopeptidase domain